MNQDKSPFSFVKRQYIIFSLLFYILYILFYMSIKKESVSFETDS